MEKTCLRTALEKFMESYYDTCKWAWEPMNQSYVAKCNNDWEYMSNKWDLEKYPYCPRCGKRIEAHNEDM